MRRIGRGALALALAVFGLVSVGPAAGAITPTFHVFVPDGSGTPIAGVFVLGGGSGGVTNGTTGVDGTFVSASSGSADGFFRNGTLSLAAMPPAGSPFGFATVTVPVTPAGGAADIALPAAARIKGVVSGPSGPLAGATVTLDGGSGGCTPTFPSGTRTTAADGSYTFDNLGPLHCSVRFEPPAGSTLAPEFWNGAFSFAASTPIDLGAGATVAGIDAQLVPGATLRGRVVEPGEHRSPASP